MYIGDFVGVSESKGEAWVGDWGYVSAQPSPRQVRLAHLPRGKAGLLGRVSPSGYQPRCLRLFSYLLLTEGTMLRMTSARRSDLL